MILHEKRTDMLAVDPQNGVAWAQQNLVRTMGARFQIATARPSLDLNYLFPGERKFIASAVPKRQAEFSTARICAREALAHFGQRAVDLTPNPDRSPRWPSGFVGSISHCSECCAVAVTNCPTVVSCGIDVEQATELPTELEALICTERERAWLAQQESGLRGILGKAMFSAKEAFFKCQFAMTRAMLEFTDVELQFGLDAKRFEVIDIRFPDRCAETSMRLAEIDGRFALGSSLIISVAVFNLREP